MNVGCTDDKVCGKVKIIKKYLTIVRYTGYRKRKSFIQIRYPCEIIVRTYKWCAGDRCERHRHYVEI